MTVVSNDIKDLIYNLKLSKKEDNLSNNGLKLWFLDVWEGVTGSTVVWAYDLDWDFEFEVEFTLINSTLFIAFWWKYIVVWVFYDYENIDFP